MGRLVQGVHGQPAPGVGYRRLPLAERPATPRKPLQRTSQLLTQALRLEELPVVEGDAVAQAETGHEIVPVQRNGLRQRRQAIWAYLRYGVTVPLALGEEAVKPGYVDPDSVVVESHAFPVGAQPTLRTGLAQRREGPTQGGAGATLVVLGPEQAGESIPGVPLLCDG